MPPRKSGLTPIDIKTFECLNITYDSQLCLVMGVIPFFLEGLQKLFIYFISKGNSWPNT